jgi:hypothetical protein
MLAAHIYFSNIVTLQQRYRHNGILVISTTEHREPDLQTKIVIHPGLPTRLRGSENNNFIQGVAMNTKNYICGHWIEAIKVIIFHSGTFV